MPSCMAEARRSSSQSAGTLKQVRISIRCPKGLYRSRLGRFGSGLGRCETSGGATVSGALEIFSESLFIAQPR